MDGSTVTVVVVDRLSLVRGPTTGTHAELEAAVLRRLRRAARRSGTEVVVLVTVHRRAEGRDVLRAEAPAELRAEVDEVRAFRADGSQRRSTSLSRLISVNGARRPAALRSRGPPW